MKQKKLRVREHQSLRIYPQPPSPGPAPATFISHQVDGPQPSPHPPQCGGTLGVTMSEGGREQLQIIKRKTKKGGEESPSIQVVSNYHSDTDLSETNEIQIKY